MKRKTPLPRKRAAPRRFRTPRCDVRGCQKPMQIITGDAGAPAWTNTPTGYCRSHARIEALARWSASIRKGYCELATWHQSLGVRCGGHIVGCHGFGKGAYPGVMFEPWNGFSGCSGINQWTEDHPLEWDDFLRSTWGEEYEPRRRQALTVRKYDLAEVLARYLAS